MKRTTLLALLTLAGAALLATGCSGGDDTSDGVSATPGGARAASASASASVDKVAFWQSGGAAAGLPGITVVGSGTARAVPDVAEWSFGVQTNAGSAEEALDAASEAIDRIVGALRDAGIAKDDIRTEQVSLYPQTTDDGREVTGYSASSTVHVVVKDLDRAGPVVDAAVEAGANQVYGPTLRVGDSRAQYRAAADAAFDDAKARAEALAAKAGLTLGAPVAIVESGGGSPAPVLEEVAAADAAGGVRIEPGVQEIGATLTVTFAVS